MGAERLIPCMFGTFPTMLLVDTSIVRQLLTVIAPKYWNVTINDGAGDVPHEWLVISQDKTCF